MEEMDTDATRSQKAVEQTTDEKSLVGMQTELKVRKTVGRQLDDLIRGACRCVQVLEGSSMEENQIRNLVNVAATSESLEEVTNFIRYQMGRDGPKRTWRHTGSQKKSFGELVIEDIEKGTVQKALKAVLTGVPEADKIRVRSELIALYLGYMNRSFTYAKKARDWKQLCSTLDQKQEEK